MENKNLPKETITESGVRNTLLCYFYFSTAKLGLFDVLHTEVAAAMGVDLGLVPGGGFIIGTVGVRRSWEMVNTKGHFCGKAHKRANCWNINFCVRGETGVLEFPACVYVCASMSLHTYLDFFKNVLWALSNQPKKSQLMKHPDTQYLSCSCLWTTARWTLTGSADLPWSGICWIPACPLRLQIESGKEHEKWVITER